MGQTTQRILQVCNGFNFAKAGAPACAKVMDVRLDLKAMPPAAEEVIVANRVVLNFSKIYRVTVNDFIQSGGDGFNVLGRGQNIEAMVDHLRGSKASWGHMSRRGMAQYSANGGSVLIMPITGIHTYR